MLRSTSFLKYSFSKSLNARFRGIHRIVSHRKPSVTSVHRPFFITQRMILEFMQDSKCLQSFVKQSSLYGGLVLRRNISTSSSRRNNKKEKKQEEEQESFEQFLKRFLRTTIPAYLTFFFLMRALAYETQKKTLVSWDEFKNEMLARGEVKRLIIDASSDWVVIFLHPGAVIKDQLAPSMVYFMSVPEKEKLEDKLREAEKQLGIPPEKRIPVEYKPLDDNSLSFLKFLFLIGLILFFTKFRNLQIPKFSDLMPISKARFTLIDPLAGQGKGVKFSDVAGLREAKIEIMEFVDYLKRPEYYKSLGAKVPKGALLLGPPGCGKTLLAKAVATEASVPFLSMNGSEFVEMIGGLGAARVRDLFKEANKRIPCIVYIDEIDAIGKNRSSNIAEKEDREREQTLNQLLVEMDGMVSNEGVVLLASTNRAEVLDKALLRPGRFDRQILIDLPNFVEREQIFEQHLKGIHLEDSPKKYSKRMAHLTPGFSGADIANVCNEAALHAARHKKHSVSGDDLEYAVERVVGGTEKRSSAMSMEEKKILAYHEAGRALVGWLSKYGEMLLKVTIVPRTHLATGWTRFSKDDKYLYSKEELRGKMCIGLGGRVAVSLAFNKVTTGGEKDLKKVTKLAYAQIRHYGMGETVGLMAFDPSQTDHFLRKPYSKQLSAMYDLEARTLIASTYKETEKLLKENYEKLTVLAQELLKKETLNYDDLVRVIGPPAHSKKKLVEPFEFDRSLDLAAGPEPEEPERPPQEPKKEE